MASIIGKRKGQSIAALLHLIFKQALPKSHLLVEVLPHREGGNGVSIGKIGLLKRWRGAGGRSIPGGQFGDVTYRWLCTQGVHVELQLRLMYSKKKFEVRDIIIIM